jgi:predicted dehydrogenase
MSALRCAVIGVGYLGRFHAQKFKTLEKNEMVQLVSVCDNDPARAKEIGLEIGCSFESDYKKLAGQVDAVSIAASTLVHFDVAKFFLSNGIHVFVEKPICPTSFEGQELVQIARDKKLALQVGHIERFSPPWEALQPELNSVLFSDFQRVAPFGPRSNSTVDVVIDLMVHDLDLILSFEKTPVRKIQATGVKQVTEFNDVAFARIEFESGSVANVSASRVAPLLSRKAIIVQKHSTAHIDFGQLSLVLTRAKGAAAPEIEAKTFEKTDTLFNEIQSFVMSVKEGTEPRVNGHAGVAALKLAESVLESINRS